MASVHEETLRGPTIAPAAPGLLVIAFDRFGEGGVDHITDVGFVDPHSIR